LLANEIPDLGKRLNKLAEVLERKPLTEAAVLGWFDVLKEFPAPHVFSLIDGWAKTHPKFPVPNDLWKVCNEGAAETRERVAVAEKKAFDEGWKKAAATPYGKQQLAEIRKILSAPKPTPEQHWKRVLKTAPIESIAYRFAESFFAKRSLQVMVEREPGQDEEELAEMPL